MALTHDELERREWDAVVIGTGIGGATLGLKLAEAGWRVLFCEKGRSGIDATGSVRGEYPELQAGRSGAVLDGRDADLLRSAGRYTEALNDTSASRVKRFVPFIGSGAGGSSALYGMAFERFMPCDFTPRANHPHADDSALPEAWPVSYETMTPYYAAAEALYRVRAAAGSGSVLEPPALTPAGAELHGFLAAKGLHPYRLPMACEYVPGCEGCQGVLCPRDCKNDATRICLRPAVTRFGATLIDGCEVRALDADRTHVNGAVCEWRGRPLRLRARTVVLAAGALQTPGLLLRSRSADWPEGLANGSGHVGRNLMRHFVDLYPIESPQRDVPGFDNRQKEIAFNDFYLRDGIKLGSVQSFGRLPPVPVLLGSLKQDLRDSAFPWAAPLLPMARPVLAPVLQRMVRGTVTLATTLEDLPYHDNTVTLASAQAGQVAGAGDLTIAYRIRAEGHARIRRMRQLMGETLATRRWRRVAQADNNQRIAHVCGTCRFGTDPKSSVLDANNRAHELGNLYVLDSAFLPSSGGTNPSLTVAANALRVADHLLR